MVTSFIKKIQHILSRIGNLKNQSKSEAYTLQELQELEENEGRAWRMNINQEKDDLVQANWDGCNILHLKNETNGAEIYLIGTIHTSQKSKALVKKMIRAIRPNYVMVEMRRVHHDWYFNTTNLSSYSAYIYRVIYKLLFENIQGKLRAIFHVFGLYGKEMKVAVEEGHKVGARIVLEDDYNAEDIETSNLRNSCRLDIRSRDMVYMYIKNIYSDMESYAKYYTLNTHKVKVKSIYPEDVQSKNQLYMARRNQRWANSLWYLKGKVVGVVGWGHLNDIKKLWDEKSIEMRR